VRAGPRGHYRVDGLRPGAWQVRRVESDVASAPSFLVYRPPEGEFDADCHVFEGAVTRFDLDLTARTRTTLRGELAMAGVSLSDWTATLSIVGTHETSLVASCSLDAEGRFTLEAKAGRCVLAIAGPCGESAELALTQSIDLTDSATWKREIPVGRVRGRLDAERRPEIVTGRIPTTDGRPRAELSFRVAEDGSFGPLVVPVGELSLSIRERDGSTTVPPQLFTITADRTTEIDLR
jgi:hypothetical protein